MLITQWRRYTGWAALAAGCFGILAAVFLILFFAFEAPQGAISTLPFGFLSDFLPIIAALPAMVVIGMLSVITRKGMPLLRATAALLGLTGTLITAATNTLFVLGRITLAEQIQMYFISIAPLGFWHILVNILARQGRFLPERLTRFGILVGVSQVISFIIFFGLDGYNAMISNSLAVIMTNIPLLISLAVGFPLSLIGYIGPPIWLVWLGRVLVRGGDLRGHINTLASHQG